VKPTISIAELEKVNVRVGTIQRAEDLTNSDRLVRLTVGFGDHRRRIIAGLKQERGSPQEVEGQQALFVVNLEPRRIRGDVSEGILSDVGYPDGIVPVLAAPERPVPDGTRLG